MNRRRSRESSSSQAGYTEWCLFLRLWFRCQFELVVFSRNLIYLQVPLQRADDPVG